MAARERGHPRKEVTHEIDVEMHRHERPLCLPVQLMGQQVRAEVTALLLHRHVELSKERRARDQTKQLARPNEQGPHHPTAPLIERHLLERKSLEFHNTFEQRKPQGIETCDLTGCRRRGSHECTNLFNLARSRKEQVTWERSGHDQLVLYPPATGPVLPSG
jgi:hypothetical protein